MTGLVLLFGLIIVTAATFAHEPMPGALYWSAIPVVLIVGLLAEAFYRGRRHRRKDASNANTVIGTAYGDDAGDMLDYIWDGFRDEPVGGKSDDPNEFQDADSEPRPFESDFVDKVVDGVTGGASASD